MIAMSETADSKLFVTMTYEDVENLIYQQVHNFRRANGGDFHELLSIANEAFMKVYRDPNGFDHRKGAKFGTWIGNKVWWALASAQRTGAKRLSREVPADIHDENVWTTPCEDNTPFAWDLSEDAETLLAAALEAPEEMKALGRAEPDDALMCHALENLGWTWERLTESWVEIQEALR